MVSVFVVVVIDVAVLVVAILEVVVVAVLVVAVLVVGRSVIVGGGGLGCRGCRAGQRRCGDSLGRRRLGVVAVVVVVYVLVAGVAFVFTPSLPCTVFESLWSWGWLSLMFKRFGLGHAYTT